VTIESEGFSMIIMLHLGDLHVLNGLN